MSQLQHDYNNVRDVPDVRDVYAILSEKKAIDRKLAITESKILSTKQELSNLKKELAVEEMNRASINNKMSVNREIYQIAFKWLLKNKFHNNIDLFFENYDPVLDQKLIIMDHATERGMEAFKVVLQHLAINCNHFSDLQLVCRLSCTCKSLYHAVVRFVKLPTEVRVPPCIIHIYPKHKVEANVNQAIENLSTLNLYNPFSSMSRDPTKTVTNLMNQYKLWTKVLCCYWNVPIDSVPKLPDHIPSQVKKLLAQHTAHITRTSRTLRLLLEKRILVDH